MILILKEFSFEPFNSNIYILKYKKKGILLLLYINDLLTNVSTITDIYNVKSNLRKYYKLKNLKKAKRYLEFNFIYNNTDNTVVIT